jgi:hypothetical protein
MKIRYKKDLQFRGFLLMALLAGAVQGAEAWERAKYNFNSEWRLYIGDTPEGAQPSLADGTWKAVTLPRAFNEDEAFRVSIDRLSDTVMWYRKHFSVENPADKKVFVEFEGVRQGADFYLNGEKLGFHENGIMAVGYDLTPYIKEGDNVLAVRVDNSWTYRERETKTKYQWNDHNFNANYGGIPKNVFLHITPRVYQTLPLYSALKTTGVYVYATDFDIKGRRATVHAESEVKNETDSPQEMHYRVRIFDAEHTQVAEFNGDAQLIQPGQTAVLQASSAVAGLHFWSWGYGYLYTVETALINNLGEVVDNVETRTGFRKTEFHDGKIWLNDRVLQMHGYAQRSSNEWPAVGLSVPAWLSDYSNRLMVESGGNLVRWMHITPWKQDIESCDRVGLIQAMPAGDSERDKEGRQWEQRMEVMRDAMIYNRNNPSILFYESGNKGVSAEHIAQMKQLRDTYDPYGGRATGSREMLDIDSSEYGGEMLYINRSKKHPMWAMEYCRDEGLRKYWDAYSYPYHKEGAGPLYKGADASDYNHNQDIFAVELIRRWYDYWRERPGNGDRCSSGGAKIVFSDTNTHFRGEENYRRSGVTDAMRLPKDGFYVHQVMWRNTWVDSEGAQTYIIGHWNYPEGTVKPVYVASNGEDVELFLNGNSLGHGSRAYNFLYTFNHVPFVAGTLKAVSYDAKGAVQSEYTLQTAGEPAALHLSSTVSPEGLHADGADMALLEFEVVDAQGIRCPLDNRAVTFTVEGPAEWRGGLAQGPDNYILSTTLPVECGVNRALLRSTTTPGNIRITAHAEGLPEASITLTSQAVDVANYLPQRSLPGYLGNGETPSTPSYSIKKRAIDIASVKAGSNQADVSKAYDDNEASEWKSDGSAKGAWITFDLVRKATVSDIVLKLSGWRSQSYPIEVYAGKQKIWEGNTEKSLGYIHLQPTKMVRTKSITIRLKGEANQKDAFGITELAGGAANTLDMASGDAAKRQLRIVEAEFLE